MLKRTKGRLLLTLLVITGLAGTINDTSLSKQERKFVVTQFKEGRQALLDNVKGLSETQLNFKSAPDRWSIKECIFHITLTEKGLWGMLEEAMKKEARPEERAMLKQSDQNILDNTTNRSNKLTAPDPLQPSKATWTTAAEALDVFKADRAVHTRYARISTEDFRNHVIQLSSGPVDAYQLMLIIAGHSRRHTSQIEEIKKDPAFPKQ